MIKGGQWIARISRSHAHIFPLLSSLLLLDVFRELLKSSFEDLLQLSDFTVTSFDLIHPLVMACYHVNDLVYVVARHHDIPYPLLGHQSFIFRI